MDEGEGGCGLSGPRRGGGKWARGRGMLGVPPSDPLRALCRCSRCLLRASRLASLSPPEGRAARTPPSPSPPLNSMLARTASRHPPPGLRRRRRLERAADSAPPPLRRLAPRSGSGCLRRRRAVREPAAGLRCGRQLLQLELLRRDRQRPAQPAVQDGITGGDRWAPASGGAGGAVGRRCVGRCADSEGGLGGQGRYRMPVGVRAERRPGQEW